MQPTKTSLTASNPFLVRQVTLPAGNAPDIQAPPESDSAVITRDGDHGVEPPIETYESRNGVPYLVDVLDIAVVFGKSGQEDQIRSIDSYILGHIEKNGLKATKASYEAVIDELKEKLEINEHLDYPDMILKLYTYTKMLREERQLKAMRDLFYAQ